jgi:hypothetical protein
MTDRPMDVKDWLNQQQRQTWEQEQIDRLLPDGERDAAIAQRVQDRPYDAAESAAIAASDAEEALGDVITEARDLRKKVAGGVVSPDDARHALAELREQHREIAAHVPSIKAAYERALKTFQDAAARVAELTSRFRGLRQ